MTVFPSARASSLWWCCATTDRRGPKTRANPCALPLHKGIND